MCSKTSRHIIKSYVFVDNFIDSILWVLNFHSWYLELISRTNFFETSIPFQSILACMLWTMLSSIPFPNPTLRTFEGERLSIHAFTILNLSTAIGLWEIELIKDRFSLSHTGPLFDADIVGVAP